MHWCARFNYLVMQLVAGQDLVGVLAERGALLVAWAVAIAAQVATVLAAAHAVSRVHRDLKPRNIMLGPDGTVTVLDFGVAAVASCTAARWGSRCSPPRCLMR